MPIPRELASACADVAAAGAADTIAGRRARYVAAPASTAEASALLRAAAGLGLSVVPRGAGRLQHWGSPPDSCDLIVDTRRLNRVVEHDPGVLAVTVQAGVRLPDLEKVVEASRQTLAMLPPRVAMDGTVGGLIATNAAGSSRYRYGTPRDLLIAITAVRADGMIVRSGHPAPGVAERDLVPLFAGSYGSLGLITEATFRLHPLPQASAGVFLPCADPEDAARLVEIVSDPRMAAAGIDLSWRAGVRTGLVVLVEGDRQGVEEREERLYALAGYTAPPLSAPASPLQPAATGHAVIPPDIARRMLAGRNGPGAAPLDPPRDPGTLLRVSFQPGQLAGALTAIQAAAAGSGVTVVIGGSAGAGVLDVDVPAGSPSPDVARFAAELRAGLGRLGGVGTAPEAPRAVIVSAPDEVRSLAAENGPARSLMRAVKDEFDPEHRMAPGRLAEAI